MPQKPEQLHFLDIWLPVFAFLLQYLQPLKLLDKAGFHKGDPSIVDNLLSDQKSLVTQEL